MARWEESHLEPAGCLVWESEGSAAGMELERYPKRPKVHRAEWLAEVNQSPLLVGLHIGPGFPGIYLE